MLLMTQAAISDASRWPVAKPRFCEDYFPDRLMMLQNEHSLSNVIMRLIILTFVLCHRDFPTFQKMLVGLHCVEQRIILKDSVTQFWSKFALCRCSRNWLVRWDGTFGSSWVKHFLSNQEMRPASPATQLAIGWFWKCPRRSIAYHLGMVFVFLSCGTLDMWVYLTWGHNESLTQSRCLSDFDLNVT